MRQVGHCQQLPWVFKLPRPTTRAYSLVPALAMNIWNDPLTIWRDKSTLTIWPNKIDEVDLVLLTQHSMFTHKILLQKQNTNMHSGVLFDSVWHPTETIWNIYSFFWWISEFGQPWSSCMHCQDSFMSIWARFGALLFMISHVCLCREDRPLTESKIECPLWPRKRLKIVPKVIHATFE